MASPGLLFLLLVSSSLLLSISASPNQNQLEEVSLKKFNKDKDSRKEIKRSITDNIVNFGSLLMPFLALIPVHGDLISAIVGLALGGVSMINSKDKQVLDALKYEFESLNSKLDEYHVEQKWDTWASGAYHKPEKNIEVAWTTYKTLLRSLQHAKDNDERKRLKDEFINAYSKYEPATKTLYHLLKPEGTTFINNLGDVLAEHVKCHEKDIGEYTVLISKLIYKGNTMNEFYYRLKKTESPAKVDEAAKIAYESASAMFQIHKSCISNSIKYIKKDVEGLIDKTKKRQELAKTVRSFLEKTYHIYDWMVVAFITKNSKRKFKTFNKHVLSGFTEVTKEGVSVAVARQVKGNHTKAGKVKQAIDKCFAKSVLCYEAATKLSECEESVEGPGDKIKVSQTYTAVHAFTNKAHDSKKALDAKEAPEEVSADPQDPSANIPYIYIGKCNKFLKIKGGKFVVLIKSDEEMMTKDPCSKLDCGGDIRGKCVRVEDVFVAMCECKHPYYGKNCEQSLEDYKKLLKAESKTVVVMDKRRRNKPK